HDTDDEQHGDEPHPAAGLGELSARDVPRLERRLDDVGDHATEHEGLPGGHHAVQGRAGDGDDERSWRLPDPDTEDREPAPEARGARTLPGAAAAHLREFFMNP